MRQFVSRPSQQSDGSSDKRLMALWWVVNLFCSWTVVLETDILKAPAVDLIFFFVVIDSLRVQSVLHMKMFRAKKDLAQKNNRVGRAFNFS